jgi:hypothetical protein
MRRGSFNQWLSFVGRKYFSMSWGMQEPILLMSWSLLRFTASSSAWSVIVPSYGAAMSTALDVTGSDSPAALQLRAMNIIYETTKERGTTIPIPTSMVDSISVALPLALAGKELPPKTKP